MNKRYLLPAIMIVLISLVAAACGGGGAGDGDGGAEAVGDPANGEELFMMNTIGANNAPGCITCHSLEEGVTQVGPSMAGMGEEAEEEGEAEGLSAAEFIRQSIVDPNAVVTEGFSAGIMYQNYEQDLTEQQINDLVAFLLQQ